MLMTLVAGVLLATGLISASVFAQKQAVPMAPSKQATANAPSKQKFREDEVKRLLLLIDTDKNGKISKQDWMNFMDAEFDTLDKDKSGEIDPKELMQSRVRPASFPPVGK
jgi:Ca2+-binding EF-hand superfamily protein